MSVEISPLTPVSDGEEKETKNQKSKNRLKTDTYTSWSFGLVSRDGTSDFTSTAIAFERTLRSTRRNRFSRCHTSGVKRDDPPSFLFECPEQGCFIHIPNSPNLPIAVAVSLKIPCFNVVRRTEDASVCHTIIETSETHGRGTT